MRKIKKFLALLVMGSALSTVFASGADIVVLMDSSGTILPWFDEINNRILVDITNKFVREGDTFHLVSFNARVNLEIVQPVNSEADVSRIVSRFMLLYPLGQNSDFLSGLQYIWQYVSSLDPQRQKIIIVISDGIFNPPPSSPYASLSTEQIRSEITQVSRKIRGAGWNVYYIKLPFPQDAVIRTLDGNLLSPSTATAEGMAGSNSAGSIVTGSNAAGSNEAGSIVTGSNAAGSNEAGSAVTGSNAAGSTNASGSKDSGNATSNRTAGGSKEGTATSPAGTKQYFDVSSEFTSNLDIAQSELPENDVPITFVDQVFSMPEISFPEDLGKKGRFFILPLKVKNHADDQLNMDLSGVYINDDVNVLSENAFLSLSPRSNGTLRAEINLPDTVSKGPQDIVMRLQFSDNLRVLPQSASVHLTVTGFSFGKFFRTGSSVLFTIIIIAIAVILVILLFFFILHRTARPASDAIRSAAELQSSADKKQSVKPSLTPAMEKTQAANAKNTAVAGTSEKTKASEFAVLSDAEKARALSASDRNVLSAAGKARATEAEEKSVLEARKIASGSEAESASILSAASAIDKGRKQTIDFQKEKRILPEASAIAAPIDSSKAISALSESQLEERKARLATLSNAIAKKAKAAKTRQGANANEPIEVRGSSRIMLELCVHNQNPNVGKRNIHMLKAGSRLSVGGGQSSFLVFLVKFPARIAEIRYDGVECSLAILKPEYFPYETENVIKDCIGRNITIVSDRDYEVTMDFRPYEDPVAKLNRLLTSIKY